MAMASLRQSGWVFLLLLSTFCFVTAQLRADNELVIVSPHWEGIQWEFEESFRAYHQAKYGADVRVRWRDLGGTSQIEKALDAGFKANPATVGIDIFFGGGMDPFENQKRKGQLLPYPLPAAIAAQVPATVFGIELSDKDHAFYGAALSSFGILENTRVKKTLSLPDVATWEDLGNPRLCNWVSSSDPRKSGSVHMIYEIILQAYGWEKGWQVIYASSGNVRSFLQSSSAPTKEVSCGDAAYAVALDLNGLTQQGYLGKENVRFFIPEGVSVINPDGIAILKGAPNLETAQRFMDFVMSEDGQKLWMRPVGSAGGPKKYGISRMGVIPSLYSSEMGDLLVPLNPFTAKQGFHYDNALGSKRWSVVNDLMGQTIVDVHHHLRTAWLAANRAPEAERTALLAELTRPVITEPEALECAAYWRKDRLRAGRTANAWMANAVARYKKITAQAAAHQHTTR